MSDLESVWRYSTGVLNAEQEIRVEALNAAAKVVDSVGSRALDAVSAGPDEVAAAVLGLAARVRRLARRWR